MIIRGKYIKIGKRKRVQTTRTAFCKQRTGRRGSMEEKSENERMPKLPKKQVHRKSESEISDPSARYQKMSMSMPGAQINYDDSMTSDVVGMHTHTFYEILFICRGQDVQYLFNNNRYQLKKGDIMLIPPGTPHRPLFLHELTEPYERYALWIETEFFENETARFPELNFALEECRKTDSGLLRGTEALYSSFHAAFHSLWVEQQSGRYGYQAEVTFGAMQLMVYISRLFYYRNASVAEMESENLFDETLRYIDEHLEQKLTLESVAQNMCVSKSTISHLFQKQLGVSFYRTVIQRRLIVSRNRIVSGVPLSQVWESCGFADYSSFYRHFKKEYGISPREFRAGNKQK